MKIDANVVVINGKDSLTSGQKITIPIDEDYISDGDDIIQEVESAFFEKYGVNMVWKEDFVIENYDDLCEDLFNAEDGDFS